MTRLMYCNTDRIADEDVEAYLRILPGFMRADVSRYRNKIDQKSRLLARLMLYSSLIDEDKGELIYDWKRNQYNKPFIEGWKPFNIAHSGKMIVLSYGSDVTGIDIEKKEPLNYREIAEYFHPEEEKYIMKSSNRETAFYEIWVKREAFFKAIGTGLVNDLKAFDCTREKISHANDTWYFYPVYIDINYTSYLCSRITEDKISMKKFSI